MEEIFHIRAVVAKMGIDAKTRTFTRPEKITHEDILFLRKKAIGEGMRVGDIVSSDFGAEIELWGTQKQARRFADAIALKSFSAAFTPY